MLKYMACVRSGVNQSAIGSKLNEADLFVGTPYCWFLDSACGTTDLRIPAYVHNAGRMLRQPDATHGTYYTFRDASTYARADQQIWYVESNDNGSTWSAAAGVFVDPATVIIDGQPLDAATNNKLSDVEMVLDGSRYQTYFSTQDSNGDYVMGTAQGRPSDALFWDSFDPCE